MNVKPKKRINMDFKTPKSSQITDTAVAVGSAFGGAAVSNVIVASIIGEPKAETDAKKAQNKKKLVKGLAMFAAAAGACFVHGNDTSAQVTRNALIGAAATQGISLAKEFVGEDNQSKVMKQAVGLACPCEQGASLGLPQWIDSAYTYYEPTSVYVEPAYIAKRRNLLTDFSAE